MQYRLLKRLIRKKNFSVKAEGVSMLPILKPGDILHLIKTGFQNVKEGDLVMVSKNRQFMVHRVIYKSTKFLITKGDHALKSDGRIRPENVHAVLAYLTRNGQSLRPEDYYLIQAGAYQNELIKITRAFTQKYINYVFLKGLPLYLHLQKNLPSRLYADCDLLISPNDYMAAAEVLEKTGFRPVESSYSPLFKLLKKVPTETVFIKKTPLWTVVLDIHQEPAFLMNQISELDALYPQKLINKLTGLFLERKRVFNYKNIKYNLLSAEHQILYLALHFFHHSFSGFYRLILMRSACRKLKGGWQELAKLISEYRLENFTYPSFHLLNKYYPQTVPPIFLRKIKPISRKLKLVKKILSKMEIESEGNQLSAGKKRFLNIFRLSPQPYLRKLTVFLYPSVLNAASYLLSKKIQAIAGNYRRRMPFFSKV